MRRRTLTRTPQKAKAKVGETFKALSPGVRVPKAPSKPVRVSARSVRLQARLRFARLQLAFVFQPRAVQPKRAAFPSARQKGCAGLKPQFYPPYLRGLVDYDYADELSPADRQWLAAFTEEHYRGLRFKGETQVTTIEHLRAADASKKRVSRAQDVMAFGKHMSMASFRRSLDETRSALPAHSEPHVPSAFEFALVAGSAGLQAHELRARNRTEDDLIDELDERRAAVERAATASRRK